MAERIAIVGARNASPETLAKVRELVESLPDGAIVVSGGAAGVDAHAAHVARERRLDVIEYRAHTDDGTYITCDGREILSMGRESMRDALIFRNTLIAIRCTRMVAFVEGSKGGTWDAVAQAKRFRRPCEVRR